MTEPAPAPSPPSIEEDAKTLAPHIELSDPAPSDEDDPAPNDTLKQMMLADQQSAALRPAAAAATDLYSSDADKAAARKKLQEDYKAAYEAKPKGLKARFDRADQKLKRAGDDMAGRLDAWIGKWLDKDKGLWTIFATRKQVEDRLNGCQGEREALRDRAAATSAQWQTAFADWSAPHARIDKILADYEDRIDKLNADINTDTDADLAIYQFWFEVAPKHMQLCAHDPGGQYPGIAKITAKLEDFPEFANFLAAGPKRPDGSVYLINPQKLPHRREVVFTNLNRAAKEQAKRETDYRLRPDDTVSLKKRRDALIQNRTADVKAKLQKPAA